MPLQEQQARGGEDSIEAVVSALYDGVTCPGDWYDALDAMRERLGAACFHSLTVRRDDFSVASPGLANMEAPADRIREYELHHAPHDLRMEMAMAMPLGVVVTDHDHFGEHTIENSPFYVDWLGPLGLRYTLATSLRVDGETREVLGFIRPKGDAPFDADSQGFCRRLLPHLMRASELRARMQQLALHAATGLSALDALHQGIAVVDEGGFLHYINRKGEACTGEAGPCAVTHGRLSLVTSRLQAVFQQLVLNACAQFGAAKAGALRVPTSAGTSIGLAVLPLKASHPLASFRQRHLALVVFACSDADSAIDPQVLAELLSLSPTEARLALLLAAGRTVKDFTAVQQCSEHTARTHLRNLMQKTGCHRQVELVRLVQSLRVA